MNENTAIFARCSLGKGRWFWAIWPSWEAMCNQETPASGYASSPKEAEDAVRAVVPHAKCYIAGAAANYHRRCCVRRRAAKPPSKQTDATVQEFLYADSRSDYDDEWSSQPHLIVKKTEKRFFIERDAWQHHDEWGRRTLALPRAELEKNGCVWSRVARERFYTSPHDQREGQRWSSPELMVLGLKSGACGEEIKTAYRLLARQHHPDRCGDPEKFKKIHAAYPTFRTFPIALSGD